jgi:DNA (cytosine-5)-methyltransferase 1
MTGGLRELALFAGAGGGILGGHLLGWRTVCAVERDPYAASVLCARQNDGFLPPFPIWDDVCTFDGRPWKGRVDVVSGGFPCQDISSAGKGAGITGERSGLWRQMARIIGEVRPRYIFVENSPMLIRRGLADVVGDLASLGYASAWGVVAASDVEAPHIRQRIWILGADETGGRTIWDQCTCCDEFWCNLHDQHAYECDCPSVEDWDIDPYSSTCREVANAGGKGLQIPKQKNVSRPGRGEERRTVAECSWWTIEPDVGRVANGVAARVDRLKAIGNGQVPAVAALAWRILTSQD